MTLGNGAREKGQPLAFICESSHLQVGGKQRISLALEQNVDAIPKSKLSKSLSS
jgi:hypothetical protein